MTSCSGLLVELIKWMLWFLFIWLEVVLYVPYHIFQTLFQTTNTAKSTCMTNSRPKKTVVIVGGSFSGLAALWHLIHHNDIFRIVLVDINEYFEYTPGILRLFVQPHYFSKLIQKLPNGGKQYSVVQGKVINIVQTTTDSTNQYQKVLTVEKTSRSSSSSSSSSNPFQSMLGKLDYKSMPTLSPPSTSPDTSPTSSSSSTGKNSTTGLLLLPYDYLVLATGSTHTAPITPSMVTCEYTLKDRQLSWHRAYQKVKESRRILILGGGAVGVELAAEIVYAYGKKVEVTVVDAADRLVPSFPQYVSEYAYQWLEQRGVKIQLQQFLKGWTDKSCTLQDGTVLTADLVYVCFGGKPNSSMMTDHKICSYFTTEERRKTILVDENLRVQGRGNMDGTIFASGDVSEPPSETMKQAFHAELQGQVVAHNIIQMEQAYMQREKGSDYTPTLWKYPYDIAKSNQMPLIFVLSLGPHDGVLGFNKLCIPGILAAVVKYILEYTKVLQMKGRFLGQIIWYLGDTVVLFLSRTIMKPSTHKE